MTTTGDGGGPRRGTWASTGHRWRDGLLAPDDPDPVRHLRAASASDVLLVCDHGGNRLPSRLDLGVSHADLARHIGYDIGALAVAEGLSQALGAELVAQRYSRLVIDCNRAPHVASAMPVRSDGTDVPANAAIPPAEAAARVAELFLPYHGAIAASLERRRARGEDTVLVAIHSFTPRHGDFPAPRPWPIGLLFRHRPELAHALKGPLEAEGLLVGMNEPYSVDDQSDYTIPVHGEDRGLVSVAVEIRQDLVGSAEGQAEWAERLARVLPGAVAAARAARTPEGRQENP